MRHSQQISTEMSVHLIGHNLGFHPQAQKLDHLVQHDKQHYKEVLLSSFHLNGHTLGFQPQTQEFEPLSTAQQAAPQGSAVQ